MTESIDIEVLPVGIGTITVNGEDITKRVLAYQIEGAVGEPTVFRLQMTNVEGLIEGSSIVEVGVPADLDKVLASFNADEIESQVMESLGWGDSGNLTSKIIEVLRERVRSGTQS